MLDSSQGKVKGGHCSTPFQENRAKGTARGGGKEKMRKKEGGKGKMRKK